MPHVHRFYVESAADGATEILLSDEEAHHAIKVVRVRDGETAAVFNGQGREWLGTVARVGKHAVSVRITSQRDEPTPTPLTLRCAWLHRDKAVEEIIRRGTELGVTDFVFFEAERSQGSPKQKDKWTRLAVEACKQCGRLWLPTFVTADRVLDDWTAGDGTAMIATAERDPVPVRSQDVTGPVTLFIGPEGDWTDGELAEVLARGAQPISLGTTVFRAEVAAITAATIIQYERGVLGPC